MLAFALSDRLLSGHVRSAEVTEPPAAVSSDSLVVCCHSKGKRETLARLPPLYYEVRSNH